MLNVKKLLSHLLSLIVTILITQVVWYVLASPAFGYNPAWIAAGVIALLPLFLYISNRPDFAHFRATDWAKNLLFASLFISGSLLIDMLIGRISHPKMPLHIAMLSNFGGWITILLFPIPLAFTYCTLNALLAQMLNGKSTNTSHN